MGVGAKQVASRGVEICCLHLEMVFQLVTRQKRGDLSAWPGSSNAGKCNAVRSMPLYIKALVELQ